MSKARPLFVVVIAALTALSLGSRADTSVDDFRSDYYTDVFEAVAGEVAFEPYRGVQRGAAGTARSGSGNALDQALLLAEALDGAVHAVRIVQGRLKDESLIQLLAVTSADANSGMSTDNPNVYDPVNDPAVQKTVRDHAWVEVQLDEGSDWLALDPVFPNAQPGQSFARTSRTFDTLPGKLHQRVTMTVMQETADGRKRRLGRIEGNVADLAGAPVSLVVRGIPQFEALADDEKRKDGGTIAANPGGLLGGGLGGPAGSSAPKVEPEQDAVAQNDAAQRTVTGVEYRRELSYAGMAPEAIESTLVEFDDADSRVAREWLEFEIEVPGARARRIERDLYRAAGATDKPADVRRYSIAIVAGEMNEEAFKAERRQLDARAVDQTRSALAAVDNTDPGEAALTLMQLEAGHALTPHLINLAFASESDTLSGRLAQSAGVRIVRDVPRILITSVETASAPDGGVDTQLTLDLRLDEVSAIPLTGMPRGAASLFQRARGMQESALEGRVLARFVDDPDSVITTTRVMDAAQRQGHELVLLASPEQDPRAALNDVSPLAAERISAALQSGHQVIAPAAAARIGDRSVWGWWDVDPATGAFVGVMESGQHQAMAQYSLTLEKVGVNDAMGYVIGALTGSTATMTLYSAKMLEYGQVTPQLIQEVAAGIESLTCVTCPSVEVIVSPLAASASFESTCYEQTGYSIGTGGGFSGSVSFCENYKRGISCAASLMLGTFNVEGNVDIGPNVNLDLGPLSCD